MQIENRDGYFYCRCDHIWDKRYRTIDRFEHSKLCFQIQEETRISKEIHN